MTVKYNESKLTDCEFLIKVQLEQTWCVFIIFAQKYILKDKSAYWLLSVTKKNLTDGKFF